MKATRLRPVGDRFFEKVDMSGECWLWTAFVSLPNGQTNNGYGMFWFDGTMRLAHRLSYELLVGPIPEGLTLDHLCRVRHCVNPDHLEPVTMADNLRRGMVGHVQRAKTHCPAGHPYDEANTCVKVSHTGQRRRACRACARDYSRRQRAA